MYNNHVFLKGKLTNTWDSSTENPHFDLEITTSNQEKYCINVNVRSKIAPHNVVYYIAQNLDHPIVNRCLQLEDGLHINLQTGMDGYCIDYLRANIIDCNQLHTLPDKNSNNDYVLELEELFKQIIQKTMNNLDYRIAVWGMYYKNASLTGIHDVHMNQFNDSEFTNENGEWQDGALVVYNVQTNIAEHMFFIAFQSQIDNFQKSDFIN